MIKSLQRSFSSFPKQHLIPKSGTYPLGYYVNSIASGIKKNASKDLTIITSPNHPCTVSGVFTLNAFAAAPVQVCRSLLSTPENKFNSLIVNSGCANACTGEIGLKNSWETVKLVDAAVSEKFNAGKLSKQISSSLVCSTGVIGQQLPMDVIVNGVKPLVEGVGSLHEDWLKVAVGVMTTDTFPKLRSKEVVLPNGAKFRMAGWCKGAGMIHPNMATLLSAVFIDANVSKECLDIAVKHAVDRSFNAISVDGDTSTNDTFLVYANGAGDAAAVIEDVKSPMFKFFVDELTKFSSELSKLIVRDGEGATKLIDIVVKGGRTFDECKKVATTIATSPLVKTAIYGRDANWGRIVCAVGYSYIPDLNPQKVNLWIKAGQHPESSVESSKSYKSLHLFKDGAPFDVNEEIASEILKGEDVTLEVDLGFSGKEEAVMSTCDFSEDYIKINADYRS